MYFHRDQLVHVRPHLQVAPAAPLPHLAIRETVIASRHRSPPAFTRHGTVDRREEPPCLRHELVEQRPSTSCASGVRERDAGRCHFDVIDRT